MSDTGGDPSASITLPPAGNTAPTANHGSAPHCGQRRTEDCYTDRAKRFILCHHKRHPGAMRSSEVSRFLTHLAVEGHVTVSTQMQAINEPLPG